MSSKKKFTLGKVAQRTLESKIDEEVFLQDDQESKNKEEAKGINRSFWVYPEELEYFQKAESQLRMKRAQVFHVAMKFYMDNNPL